MARLIDLVANWNADARFETNANFYIDGNGEAADIVEGKRFLVIGRKGTGKTALAKFLYYNKPAETETVNFDRFRFQHIFPFYEKEYSDNSKYLDIWLYIIYVCSVVVIARLYPGTIVAGTIADRIIKSLTSIKGDTRPILTKIVDQIGISGVGGNFLGGGGNIAFAKTSGQQASGVSVKEINTRIQNFIDQSLTYVNKDIFILIDDIDQEMDTPGRDKQEFRFIISSLINAVAFAKSVFPRLKPVVFMREDIFFSLSNTSKWADVRLQMQWDAQKINNFIIDKICQSQADKCLSTEEAINALFDSPEYKNPSKKMTKVINHVIQYSQMRPRDVIKYLSMAANRAKKHHDKIVNDAIKDAQEEYSDFIAEGIQEELEWHFTDVKSIYEAITDCGHATFRYTALSHNLKRARQADEKVIYDIVAKLHRFGVLGNAYNHKQYFVFTHPRIAIDIQRELVVHCSVQKSFGF